MQGFEGGCLCGQVKVVADGPPRDVHYCHCTMCRRATGSPFATLVWYARAAIRWPGEEPARRRSSAIAERGFCPHCGSPIYLAYDGSDSIALTLGILDHPAPLVPSHHYGIEARLPWVDVGPDLPGRPTAADPRP